MTAKFRGAVVTIDADMLRRVQANIPWRVVACRRMRGGRCNYCSLNYVSALLCRQALYASQAMFILTCVKWEFIFALFFCSSFVHECYMQFLCSYSTLRVSPCLSASLLIYFFLMIGATLASLNSFNIFVFFDILSVPIVIMRHFPHIL